MRLSSQLLLFGCCAFLASSYGSPLDIQLQEERNKRTFSLFNVVKFKNTNCQASSSADLQGVCMTKEECSDVSGTTDGNCAAGFGTCCVIRVSSSGANCAATISQNCTYIESYNYPASITAAETCGYTINRCSSDICQIRLDFLPTVLGQPDAAAVGATAGVCGNANADSIAFTPGVAGLPANSIPILCGTLSNQHVYLEANRLADPAATVYITTTANNVPATRNWRIKVSQIECSSNMKAPQGCLQYFTGIKNTVTSFNFDGTLGTATGGNLAYQDYRVCFRQEAGMCGQTFAETVLATGDAFQLGGMTTPAANAGATAANCLQTLATINANTACLTTNADTCSFIQIPGGNPLSATGNDDVFCGFFLSQTDAAAITGIATLPTTTSVIKTTTKPFTLRHAVLGNTQAVPQAGFSLDVTQISQC